MVDQPLDALAARIEDLDVQLETIAAAELQCALAQEAGQRPGPEASALKLEFTELIQRIEETTLEVLGPRALAYTADPAASTTPRPPTRP